MSVIVRVGQVDDGENIYKAGDIIEGLSKRDEQELLAAGVVDRIESVDLDEPVEKSEPSDPHASDTEENVDKDESEPTEELVGPNTSIPGLESASKTKRNK